MPCASQRGQKSVQLTHILGTTAGDAGADAALRREAASAYLALLQKPKLPDILLKVRAYQTALHAVDSTSA